MSNLKRSHEKFAQSLVFVSRRWRNLMNQELGRVGQSQARWSTLYWIDVFGDSVNQTELASRIGVEQQTLGRVLRELHKEGLIERVPSKHDGRAKVIRLTRAAGAVMRQIAAIQVSMRERLLRGIPAEDLEKCMGVFAAILANTESTSDGSTREPDTLQSAKNEAAARKYRRAEGENRKHSGSRQT